MTKIVGSVTATSCGIKKKFPFLFVASFSEGHKLTKGVGKMAIEQKFFPMLAEPGYIGRLKIKNRFVMAPASTNYSAMDGSVTNRLLKHYEERARGGVGLIIVEYAFIDNEASKASLTQLGIYDDQLIPGLSLLSRIIKENGATAAIQIVHGGLQRAVAAHPTVAPSRIWKE